MSETGYRARCITTRDGAKLAVFMWGPEIEESACIPLIVLHGNGSSHHSFADIAEQFSQERPVVVPDMRAQGVSSRGSDSPLSYDLLARDVVDIAEALHIERACILGHSDGGIEALLLARDYPHLVAGFVALGANITTDGLLEDETEFMHQGVSLYSSLADELPKAKERAELFQLMLDYPMIAAESLSSITCPATIMAGEFDVISPQETQAIYEHIDGAELIIVSECGHSLHREAPETICSAVSNMFAKIEHSA